MFAHYGSKANHNPQPA